MHGKEKYKKEEKSPSRNAYAVDGLATSYVLTFPTLLSASTSYVGATRTAVTLNDGSTVTLKLFGANATFILHNTKGLNVSDP